MGGLSECAVSYGVDGAHDAQAPATGRERPFRRRDRHGSAAARRCGGRTSRALRRSRDRARGVSRWMPAGALDAGRPGGRDRTLGTGGSSSRPVPGARSQSPGVSRLASGHGRRTAGIPGDRAGRGDGAVAGGRLHGSRVSRCRSAWRAAVRAAAGRKGTAVAAAAGADDIREGFPAVGMIERSWRAEAHGDRTARRRASDGWPRDYRPGYWRTDPTIMFWSSTRLTQRPVWLLA